MTQPKRTTDNHYIDGDQFTEMCLEARRTGEFPVELTDMFYLLAKKSFLGRKTPRHSFVTLEQEDAVQDAVMGCIAGIKTFSKKKGDAYTFFRFIIRSCYTYLVEIASTEKRNPGNDIYNVDAHISIETDNRVSFLLMESQKQTEQGYKKLLPTDVVEIKRRLAAGEIGAEIARDYHLDPSTVSKIKAGIIWGNV